MKMGDNVGEENLDSIMCPKDLGLDLAGSEVSKCLCKGF